MIGRNVGLTAAAMLLLSLGENLWSKFLPKYLQSLGAPPFAIGAYGTAKDLLDGLYQYPGGWLGDRLGRRRALLLFIIAAIFGYAIYATADSWSVVLAGLVLVMAWSSMAPPTIFAVVGDALPQGERAMGFTVLALLKRLPMVVAPIAGGIAIARLGVVPGTRALLVINIVLAAAAILAIRGINMTRVPFESGARVSFAPGLKTLLAADIFARICEGLVDVFLVLYVTRFVSASQFGILVGIQSLTSMLVYIPAARYSGKGIVLATFLAFASFPLAVVSSTTFAGFIAAFVIGGLREIGEPSRKSMIVDFAHESVRGRTVGAYYLLRSVTIAPSATIGAILWTIDPALPFYTAFAAGLVGAAVFWAAKLPSQ